MEHDRAPVTPAPLNPDAAAQPLDAPRPAEDDRNAPDAVGDGQDPSMEPVDQALCQCPPDPDQAGSASEVPSQGSAYEFDPNELIEPGSDMDPLVRATNDAMQRALLRLQNAPREDIRSFRRFDDNATSVTAGQYVVTVNRGQFSRGTAAVCEAAKAGIPKGDTNVRICLSQLQIKLRICGPVAFETTLPVERIVLGIPDTQNIAFSLDLRHLRNLARLTADADETLTATYRADLRKLIIRSELTSEDKAKLKLSTWSADGFGGVHMEQLNAITYVRPLDASVLKKVLEFLTHFVTSKADRPDYRLVEIRDGLIVGGLYDRVGIVGSDKLNGINLTINAKYLSTVIALLAHFEASETHLFEATNYHILYDGYTFLAFQKYRHTFPVVPLGYAHEESGRILVTRSVLLEQLKLLEVLALRLQETDFLVHIRVAGTGDTVMALGLARGQSTAVGVIKCRRTLKSSSGGAQTPFTCSVDLRQLLKVVSHFQVANIEFEELLGALGCLRLRVDYDDYRLTALLGAVRHRLVPKQLGPGGRSRRS